MNKIAVGHRGRRVIDIEAPVADNLEEDGQGHGRAGSRR